MEKEIFINNVLNSANGIIKIIPDEALYKKIQAKLEDRKPVEVYTRWMVAASIMILFTLNILVLSKSEDDLEKNNGNVKLISIKNNQLY